MRRPILALSAWIAFAGVTINARANSLDRSTNGQDVTVSISSPFSEIPPGGSIPYTVNIRNDRSSPGTWHITFQGNPNNPLTGASIFEQDLSVARNSSDSFNLVVPLPVVSSDTGMRFTVKVTGPGFEDSGLNMRYFAYFFTPSSRSGSLTPYTLIGDGLLGPIGIGPLQSHYKDRSQEFYGSDVVSANLPADWRAYAGVAGIVLKDSEWLALNSVQRGAICDYVAIGGHLALYPSENTDSRIVQLQLPEPDGKPGPYGLGTISVQSTPSFPPDADSLASVVDKNSANSTSSVDEGFSTWGFGHMVGTIAVSTTFILSFVVIFGTLIGPINLFVFASGKKRFRLFWTTPLISIIASLALVVGILLTDGIGGVGRQMIAIVSMPGVNREVVVQEQIARTALLFSNGWHNDQNYLITPISNRSMNNAAASDGIRETGSQLDLAGYSESYRQVGNEYSGTWFRSRSKSGQYLQAVRPTRSVLTVMNPQAFSAGGSPVVLSSYPVALDQVFLLDAQRHYWTCKNIEPGRKQTCTSCKLLDYDTFWRHACENAGGKLSPLLRQVRDRPGFFYAACSPPAGDRLDTLSEVRWNVVQGICLGPWVDSPTPESGP